MWWLSGINRGVYILCKPNTHVHDLFARPCIHFPSHNTLTSADTVDGALDVDVTISRHYASTVLTNGLVHISLELTDSDARTVASISHTHKSTPSSSSQSLGGLEVCTLTLPVQSVLPWSAESPTLYTLRLSVKERVDEGGVEHEDVVYERVGFRSVCVAAGHLLVNGKAIKLRGVNHHEHDAVTGHVMTDELMRRDIELMKSLHFNAVRCSHYPHAEEFYEICDELGECVSEYSVRLVHSR